MTPPRGVEDAAPYSVATRKLSCCRKRPRRPEGWPPYKLPATAFVGEGFIPPRDVCGSLRGVEDAAPYNLVILFTKTLFDRLSNFPV